MWDVGCGLGVGSMVEGGVGMRVGLEVGLRNTYDDLEAHSRSLHVYLT